MRPAVCETLCGGNAGDVFEGGITPKRRTLWIGNQHALIAVLGDNGQEMKAGGVVHVAFLKSSKGFKQKSAYDERDDSAASHEDA